MLFLNLLDMEFLDMEFDEAPIASGAAPGDPG
jgi:hypothetical protein